MPNPVMVEAGKKAAATRRKNEMHRTMVLAGKKAWETRRKNVQLNGGRIGKKVFSSLITDRRPLNGAAIDAIDAEIARLEAAKNILLGQ